MTSSVSRMAQLALENAAARFRERYIDPRAFRAAQARAKPSPLNQQWPSDPFGRVEVGRRLMSGVFSFAGVDRELSPRLMWRGDAPTLGWSEEAHGFDWLSDLAAVGDDRAAETSWASVSGWLDQFAKYEPTAWRPDLTGRRLQNWLVHASLIAPKGPNRETAVQALLTGLAVHEEWLRDHWTFCDPGPSRVIAAGALATAAITLKDRDAQVVEAFARLQSALVESLDADGASVTRAPSDSFEILKLIATLIRFCGMSGREVPATLEDAARRLSRVVRFFRDLDGGLALFNGGRAYGDGRVDALAAELGVYEEIPAELPASGFQRVREGRTQILMDVGAAPTGPAARTVHAGALSISLSVGRRRVIVGCGGGAHLDAEWASSLRSSAAQSTFVLEDISSARPVLAARKGRGLRDEALVGPGDLTTERKEEANGVWVLGGHNGYVATHGLSLTRRMFLSADGGDFRGEDRLEIEADGAAAFKRRMNKLRGAQKALGAPFAVRFHLHPDVKAEMVADGEAATLQLPSGEAWVMRQSGGRLSIEPSVYIDEAGAPRDTHQIAIVGGVLERSTRVRWAFRRVGELSQMELDVAALLDPIAS
ncbi:MAG: heparinase II/III family protein [Pseudomonadota bacterium]